MNPIDLLFAVSSYDLSSQKKLIKLLQQNVALQERASKNDGVEDIFAEGMAKVVPLTTTKNNRGRKPDPNGPTIFLTNYLTKNPKGEDKMVMFREYQKINPKARLDSFDAAANNLRKSGLVKSYGHWKLNRAA